MTARARPLRVGFGAAVGLFVFLEGGCSSGRPQGASSGAGARPEAVARPGAEAPPSYPFKENSSAASPAASRLEAYERARATAWDPSRRFKALFKAEVSPKVGAIGRGYLSVWWDGASGSLEWRASAPIAGAGRGGILRVKEGSGDLAARESAALLSARLSALDLVACILGTRDAPPSADTLLDAGGRVVEMRFPDGEVVAFQPGSGVPRRIEANGPDGRAVLVLESYGPWPLGEGVPPP